jgi:hypothetical protein
MSVGPNVSFSKLLNGFKFKLKFRVGYVPQISVQCLFKAFLDSVYDQSSCKTASYCAQ